MRNILFTFFLITITVMVSYAQTVKQVVAVRAIESHPACMGGIGSGLIISYPDKIEKIELEKVSNLKDFETNAAQIRKVIADLNQKGYEMKSCSTSAWQCATETLLIFEK